ncbi:hypothetical protein SNK04_014062 [Fusarium graminearum]
MCGSKKQPKVVERDLVAEQRAAEATAASEANLALASRRRRRRESSLLTLGADGLTTGGAPRSWPAPKAAQPLGGKRQVHEQVWRDCFELTFPLRAHGFNGNVVDAQQAQNQKARIQDSTGTQASQLDVDGETPDDKRYLDNAAETIWLNIHQSNFDAEGYEACLDTVAAGWFALYVDEDRERGGYSFEQWPIAGVYITSSRRDGLVDTCYREHSMPARTAAETFGLEKLSEGTQKLAREAGRAGLDGQEPAVRVLRGRVEGKHLVRESGYHEFPVIAPRWQRIPDTSYGVGPVFDALPDIRVLNELKALQLASADVAVGGMWVAEDDGVFNPRTAKLGARKILIASSTDAIKPLQTGANFQLADFMVNDLKASIRKILMADQLQPQDGPAMTATEVHVRVEMIRQLLGPIYGRLQAEYLRPLIERCFGIAYRAGILGEPPESLAGRDYSVRTSRRWLVPSAWRRSPRPSAYGLGVPSKVMLSDTEMQAKLDARTQAAEQAKQQQMGEQAIAMSARHRPSRRQPHE